MAPGADGEEGWEAALAAYAEALGESPRVQPFGRGLIHQTFLVEAPAGRFVLQRIHPVFTPAMCDDVAAVTAHLRRRGLRTPRVVPAADGRSAVQLVGAGVWRLMTFVPGASFAAPRSLAQVRSAGELIGRFHAALADLEHRFAGVRAGIHDVDRHLRGMTGALERQRRHRLRGEVAALAAELVARREELTPRTRLVTLVGHGDLKLDNVRFAGEAAPARDRAVALIDLDTVGPIALADELGDAWRSWCNLAGEEAGDIGRVDLDLGVFETSLAGYIAGLGRRLGEGERRQLLDGVEWISFELAVRFATDALNESYFGWDPARFPGRGEHSLQRARVQLALHRRARHWRSQRARVLRLDPGS